MAAGQPQTPDHTATYTITFPARSGMTGEKPFTYAVEAGDMEAAKYAAWIWHVWEIAAENGTLPPKIPGWRDGIDVVVIDCVEFPCHEGVPFECADPYHWADSLRRTDPSRTCRCPFNWGWIFMPDSKPTPLEVERELGALGYQLTLTPQEENTW